MVHGHSLSKQPRRFTTALSLIALSMISASKHPRLLLCIALCSRGRIPCSSTCWYSMLARVVVIILYTLFRQAIGLYTWMVLPCILASVSILFIPTLATSGRQFNISIDIWRATSEICGRFLYQKGWILSGLGAFQGDAFLITF